MIVQSMFIQNFLTIGDAALDLDTKGLSLIQGENNSDPSAKSNGAGKTSIAEAICWCLYGQTARGVKGDAVVNRTAKKNCVVGTMIKSGEAYYKIERYRKHKDGKNRLKLYKLTDLAGGAEDVTKGNDKLTQAEVEKIIGSSYEVFRSAVYLAQDGMPDLPGMTDKALKEIIEESAGLTKLDEASKIASAKLSEAKKAHSLSQTDLMMAASNLDSANEILAASRKASDVFEADKKKGIDDIAARYADAEKLILRLDRELDKLFEEQKLKREAKTVRLLHINETIEGLEGEEAKRAELAGAVSKAEGDLRVARNEYEHFKTVAEKAAQKVKTVTSKIGTPCSECGKPYCEADMEEAQKIARSKAKTEIAVAKEAQKKLKQSEDALRSAQDALEAHKSSMTDVTSIVKEKSEIERILSDMDSVVKAKHNEIAMAKKDFEATRQSKAELEAKENPHKEALKEHKESVKRRQAAHMEATDAVGNAEHVVEVMQEVAEVFGRKGVRAHLLETVTPYLNERTSYYLGSLSDGNISAVWSTLSIKADGDLAERFSIDVTKEDGADNYHGLSGGEKRKVRLATSMALQDLVSSRASKPINLFIADEIDDALDDSGLERLMGVLEEKGREKGTLILISHNDIGDWVRNITRVVKDDSGTSSITGYLSRT